jgi:hypothetical protein
VGKLSRFLRKLSGTLCGDLRAERSSRAATFAYRGEMQLRVERTASTKTSQAYGATLDHERR